MKVKQGESLVLRASPELAALAEIAVSIDNLTTHLDQSILSLEVTAYLLAFAVPITWKILNNK